MVARLAARTAPSIGSPRSDIATCRVRNLAMRLRVFGQTPRDSGDTRAHTDRPRKSEADQVRLDARPAGVATDRGRRGGLTVLRSSLRYATRPDGVHGLRIDPQRTVRLSQTGSSGRPARGDKASCPSWIRPRCQYRHALGASPHSRRGSRAVMRPDAGNGNRRPFPQPWPQPPS